MAMSWKETEVTWPWTQLNRIESKIDRALSAIEQIQTGQVKEMAAIDDLNAAVANITADETAISAAIAAVQAAVAGLPASVPATAVETAVAALAAAHTSFQANVTALNAVAAAP